MAAKATNLPRGAWARQPSYLAARNHLWNVLMIIYARVPHGDIQAMFDAWAADNDYRRYVHSARLLAHYRLRGRQPDADRAWQPETLVLLARPESE